MINGQTKNRIIIGAGLYGLYAALYCAKKGESVVVLEYDDAPFKRATYINQARVHMGYHYPRSISTASKSAGYYNRFHDDFGFCINSSFDQIYATSSQFSWTSADEFVKFCHDANIPCKEVSAGTYFNDNMCDGAFLTREDTYDAMILRDHLLKELAAFDKVDIIYNVRISSISKMTDHYEIGLLSGDVYSSSFVLNATYASVNQILSLIGAESFGIKYELCEIILCEVNELLKNTGITVMDGPFFSIMPFGCTGFHSLTSVAFTPHDVSYDEKPTFSCQDESDGHCNQSNLGNCDMCKAKPVSAWPYMSSLAKKYIKDDYQFTYKKSLFSMKPILKTTEIDDSRPTVIRFASSDPTFVSVLSGKINTVYDLDEILDKQI